LHDLGISDIELVVVSHGDVDHAGGVWNLITDPDFNVHRLLVNPEHRRRDGRPTTFERRLAAALRVAERRGTEILLAATAGVTGQLGSVEYSVLWPTPSATFAGRDGQLEGVGRLSANSLSVVLHLRGGTAAALVPGDLDAVGVRGLLADERDIPPVNILLLPHHGGLLGSSDDTEWAVSTLVEMSGPTEVAISLASSQTSNPRDEVIAGLDHGRVGPVAVRCTQLSERCHPGIDADFRSLDGQRSAGNSKGACCAGTFVFDFDSIAVETGAGHDARVAGMPDALCRGLRD